MWVTNGGVANWCVCVRVCVCVFACACMCCVNKYFVLVHTDPDIKKGIKGLSGFVVDADTPEVIKGRKV